LQYDPERVVLQVGCTDYEAGSALVADMLGNLGRMAGAEPRLASGKAEPAFGWTFYALAVDKSFVRRLAGLPDIGIMRTKGATLDQKFAVWLNRQLEARAEGIRVELLSDLRSSQFGLF